MSRRTDLTRWNRAGLKRFEYIDGNAVEYLETLRQALASVYADADGRVEWLNPPQALPENELEPESESLIERQLRFSRRQLRILESYHQDRRDWAWEISRSVARACHILTGHVDAYANESYLGTATQWDNVRRLVQLLDYYPAPPASATTNLVFTTRGDTPGTLPKGFQVKYSPPDGSPKVIFETLEDLVIDPALNAMRPRDWNKSQLSAGPEVTPTGGPSALAQAPAIHIQGFGEEAADELKNSDETPFRIFDVLSLTPATLPAALEGAPLRDWQTKARLVVEFAPEADWSSISHLTLAEISAASLDELEEQSGNNAALVEALQWDVDALEVCLDDDILNSKTLADLMPTASTETSLVDTWWYAKNKPKVSAGDIAMVYRGDPEAGEAAIVEAVEEKTGKIQLESSPLQQSWFDWNISDALLKVSPRWKRKAWLNGNRVLRTREPHGLTGGTHIGWKQGRLWRYARVEDADKRNLWLDYEGDLPREDTELFLLRPIAGDIVAEDYEVVVVLGGPNAEDLTDVTIGEESLAPRDIPNFDTVFTIPEVVPPINGIPTLPLLPPAGLPKIGSFLLPTPFLPIDLVKAAVDLLLKLGIMQIPSTGEPVFEGIPPENLGELVSFLDDLYIPTLSGDDITGQIKAVEWNPEIFDADDPEAEKLNRLERLITVPRESGTSLLSRILDDISEMGSPLAVRGSDGPFASVANGAPVYVFDGSPDKLASGDWLVAEAEKGLKALQVTGIEKFVNEDSSEYFSLQFAGIDGDEGGLKKVYGDFRDALVAKDAEINLTKLDGGDIALEKGVPAGLGIGDPLLLQAEGKDPLSVTVKDIDGDTITVDPPATDLTVGHLVIYGNVVRAGHGETRPSKILGSGDAAKTNQSFVLEVDGLAFTPDATMSSGVAAAIDVQVAGQIWQQVSTLNDSAPGDPHYAVRMTEDGYVKILFGDGERGRRLPTGKNNLRVTYRVGTGLAGNVPAGGLEKAVKPHSLVDTVQQPLAAAGGGDMEDTTSLRENAPATLLALKRAVSLGDFSNLAMSRSNVWHARAHRLPHYDGRLEQVNVVVLPAGGAESDEIKEDVREFLQAHALPGVHVSVDFFKGVRFDLAVTARVDTNAFVAQEVRQSVIAALKEHFKLQRRKLGAPLYLSEVVKVVEAVQGVENSICVIPDIDDPNVTSPAGYKAVFYPRANTVLYVDVDYIDEKTRSELNVKVEAYQP